MHLLNYSLLEYHSFSLHLIVFLPFTNTFYISYFMYFSIVDQSAARLQIYSMMCWLYLIVPRTTSVNHQAWLISGETFGHLWSKVASIRAFGCFGRDHEILKKKKSNLQCSSPSVSSHHILVTISEWESAWKVSLHSDWVSVSFYTRCVWIFTLWMGTVLLCDLTARRIVTYSTWSIFNCLKKLNCNLRNHLCMPCF